MPPPAAPKIYHIVHVDRLPSIIADGVLWCDAEIVRRAPPGTTIGMNKIKQRRLTELHLSSHPGLLVGGCVPFYFCPRSVMLFLIHKANDDDLTYRGGQGPIVHLEADLNDSVAWADLNRRRWAFTLSNSGSYYFEDRCDLAQLDKINWSAVQTNTWGGNGVSRSVKEGKQAEFLVEQSFPWVLVTRIGVRSQHVYRQVIAALEAAAHRPHVQIAPDWYY
jgi:ssDNA thymidine ADP-ribosyltransferase, DarT